MNEITPAGGQAPARNSILEAALEGVPKAARQMAAEFSRLFSDRPTSEAVDAATYARKLAIHFHRLAITPEELGAVFLALETSSRFRPTIPDVLEALDRIRAEADAVRRREVLTGMIEMRDANGLLWLVPSGEVEKARSQGLELTPPPTPRTADEARAIIDRLVHDQDDRGARMRQVPA